MKSANKLIVLSTLVILLACSLIPGQQLGQTGTKPTETGTSALEPPTSAPPTILFSATQTLAGQPPSLSSLLPPGATCTFESNGDLINSWYWLRDRGYQGSGEWRCTGLPHGASLPITLVGLVTNGPDGGSGYSVPAKVTITNPTTGEAEGVQVFFQNPLPSTDPSSKNGQGYLTTSFLVAPQNFISDSGSLNLRIERLSPNPDHLALNSESLRIIQPDAAASSKINGDLISGWYWLRDAQHADSGKYTFQGLVPGATLSILTLDTLVTQGVDGGSGYSMAVEITIANPTSGEQATLGTVQAQNLMFGSNPDNSAGHGYQTYGSYLFDSKFIDNKGNLQVRIKRPNSSEYHLAVKPGSFGIVQFGGKRPDLAGGSSTNATPEATMDQSQCEVMGGKWGKIGLSPKEECNLPTTDAGKVCSDSSECQGTCIAELTKSQFDDVFRNGAIIKTDGKCTAWHITVGCIPIVDKGIVQVMCID